jgi:hypothetical protein
MDNKYKNLDNQENDDITLLDLMIKLKAWLLYLKSNFKLILYIGIIGGFTGLGVALFTKPIYKANLTFAMEDDKNAGGSGLSSALGLASSIGIDLGSGSVGGGGAFAANNLAELMKSRLIVERVLLSPITIRNKTKSLVEYYIDINELRKKWQKNIQLQNIYFDLNSNRKNYTLQQDSILKEIYKNLIKKENLSITQKDKKVTILTIEVSSENELFSKLFCEYLAKETSEFYIQSKSKKARINVDVLQRQVDSVKNELNLAISSVASEVDNVYNLNPAFNIKGANSKKRQIDVQANTAILTNLVVQLELAKINLRKETPLIQLIDKPILPLDKDKYGKIVSILIGGLMAMFLCVSFITISKFIKNKLHQLNTK